MKNDRCKLVVKDLQCELNHGHPAKHYFGVFDSEEHQELAANEDTSHRRDQLEGRK